MLLINLCNTLLPKDREQAIPADFGNIIKPTPVTDRVIEVDVAPMITILSTDSNIVFRVLYFFYPFFDLFVLSFKYKIISLMLLIRLLKLFTSFFFFSNRFSKSLFSKNGAEGYNSSHFCSNCYIRNTNNYSYMCNYNYYSCIHTSI